MNAFSLRTKAQKCVLCADRKVLSKQLSDGSIFLEDCSCVKKLVEADIYERSNIPKRYWDCSLDILNATFRKKNVKQLSKVESYMQNMDANIANGQGLWFVSAPGLAKSTIIVAILKFALQQGYRSYFLRVSKAIGLKFDALRNNQTAILMDNIVNSVDILALEEIDKVFLSNDDAMNNQLYYEFISDMYESKKALLVSSNKLPKEVLQKYPTFIQDRLRSLIPIVFVGLSERRSKARGQS